jgi:outer membrane receptor protein involved in Fe transport
MQTSVESSSAMLSALSREELCLVQQHDKRAEKARLWGELMKAISVRLRRPRGLGRIHVLASAVSAVLAGGAHVARAQEPVDEVTVTGSRIVRRDLTAASPIVTVDTAQLENSSTIGVESVLNRQPQFVPAETQFDTSGTEVSAFATPGIASVNLRGLGANRNLVLIDGRRAQPANATLVIDINTIPQAAIARVETITGGASAVYGPDALAGVVNFVLKNDFEGVDMNFQTGMTQEGDGEETRFSSLIGMNSANGNGNVMVGVEWARREAVRQIDRDFYLAQLYDPNTRIGGTIQNGGYAATSNQPSQAAIDQVFAKYGVAPGTIARTREFNFNPDGTIYDFQTGVGYNGPIARLDVLGDGFTGIKRDPTGALGQDTLPGNISSPMERRSAFGRATYDISDSLSTFVQMNYSSVEVDQVAGYVPATSNWAADGIPVDGRYIPSDLAILLASRAQPTAPWVMNRGLDFLGNERTHNKSDVYQVMAGVSGTLPTKDWTWNTYVATGQTTNLALGSGFGSLQRYRALVRAPNWGQGVVTNITPLTSNRFALRCSTGLPIFQSFTPAPECIEAIEAHVKILTELSQDVAEANMQGKILDMGAGELRFAAGVAYRKNTFLFRPPEINDDVSATEYPIGVFASNDSAGETEVSEIYGELLVPVTEGLDLEFGYRYSNFDSATTKEPQVATNTSGGFDTWKALFTWSPTQKFGLRGGVQFATRTPNTAELFTGPTVDTVTFAPSDPCSYSTLAPWGNVATNPRRLEVQELCRQLIGNNTSTFDTGQGGPDAFARPGSPFFPLENAEVAGNPSLGPEEARTWTLGVVLNGPGNLENFVTSLDFYNVEITDAINPLDAVFAYEQCFNADGSSNPTLQKAANPFCNMITRNEVTGLRSSVKAPYFNTGLLATSGVDWTVQWSTDLGPGQLSVNTVATFLGKFETQQNPGSPVYDAKGTLDEDGQFDYRLLTTLGYSFSGGSSLGLSWRYLPSVKDETAAQDPSTRILGVGSYSEFDLFGRLPLGDKFELRGGIDNLFDKSPLVVGADPGTAAIVGTANLGTTRPEFYDVLGRRFYVGFKMMF